MLKAGRRIYSLKDSLSWWGVRGSSSFGSQLGLCWGHEGGQ